MKNKSLFKMPTNQDNIKGSSAAFDDLDQDANSPQRQRDRSIQQPAAQRGAASTGSLADFQKESPEKVSGVLKGASPESVHKENPATAAGAGKGGIITSEPFAALYEEVDETDETNRSAGGRFVAGNAQRSSKAAEVDPSNESKLITASKQSLVTGSAETSSEKGLKETPTNAAHGSKGGVGGGGGGGDVSSRTGAADSSNSPLAKTKHNQNAAGASSDATNSNKDVTAQNNDSGENAKDETSTQRDVKETKKDGSQISETLKGATLMTAKNEQKDSKPSDSGGGGGSTTVLKTPTRGNNERQSSPRQSKVDQTQKPKRTPSAKSPRSPAHTRISRALMERHQKTTDANEGNKNQKNATSKAAASENPTDSKTTESKAESSKSAKPSSARDTRPPKTNSVQPADVKDATKPAEKAGGSKTSVDSPAAGKTTDKPSSGTRLPPLIKPGSGDVAVKPANGTIRSEARSTTTTKKKKDDEQKTKKGVAEEAEQNEQETKVPGIFGKAIMRRLTSLDKAQPANNQSIDLNSSLNSSAGARSLNSSTSSGLPHHPGRPAHKTQSMQSLAVPGTPGLGPTPMEADDKVSEGSRRDSVRHSSDSGSRKSVDYRLQASQAVVAGGGAEEKPKSLMLHDDSMIRAAIPALPLPLAVVCLLLNIFVPGSGTMVSGLSVLCCGKPRISSKGDAVATTVCVNIFVGAAQLATVTFLLVGWFWSLAWGVKMVIIAVEDREEQRQQREKELQTLALRAFGSPGNPLLRARSGNPLV